MQGKHARVRPGVDPAERLILIGDLLVNIYTHLCVGSGLECNSYFTRPIRARTPTSLTRVRPHLGNSVCTVGFYFPVNVMISKNDSYLNVDTYSVIFII